MLGIISGDFAGSAYRWLDMRGAALPLASSAAHFTEVTINALACVDALHHDSSDFQRFLAPWFAQCRHTGLAEDALSWAISASPLNYGATDCTAAIRAIAIASACPNRGLIDHLIEAACAITHTDAAVLNAKALGLIAAGLGVGLTRQEELEMAQDALSRPMDFRLFNEACRENVSSDFLSCIPIAVFIGITAQDPVDAIRKCLAVGGDTTSIAAIACHLSCLRHGTGGIDASLRTAVLSHFEVMGEPTLDMRRRLIASEVLDIYV